MIFNQVPRTYNISELDDQIIPGYGRVYTTPQGVRYPSVTTVLSTYNKEGLEKWKKEVGEVEAEAIKNQYGRSGTKLHNIAEKYVLNDPEWNKEIDPLTAFLFQDIKNILDKNVDNIMESEVPLYSDFLKVGGRVDLIADWQGKRSVIDFKNSRRPKRKEWILGYFLQMSAYCVMFEERTQIPINNCVVLIAINDAPAQIFNIKRNDYIMDFIKHRKTFKEIDQVNPYK